MRRVAFALPALAALAGCAPRTGGDTLAITRVTVVDVAAPDAASAARPEQTVLVAGGRVVRVGPAGEVAVPAGARIVDGRGRFVLPGLWDAHVHLTHGGASALPAYLAHGVTTLRDLGGRPGEALRWRRELREGARPGPRLLVAGPNLEGAWWIDAVVGMLAVDPELRAFPFLRSSPRVRVADSAGAVAAADSLARLGVDVIKFRNLRAEEFRALAAAARARGIPLAGHAPSRIAVGEAAEAGLSSLEHAETVTLRLGDLPDAARRAELARVARAGTAITPTLVADRAYRQTPDSIGWAAIADSAGARDPRNRLVSPALRAHWAFGLGTKRIEGPTPPGAWAESHRRQVEDVRRAREAGVPLLVGTDYGVSLVYPGSSVHEELRLLVDEAGLTPLEALRAATLAPARAMRMADSLGAVAAGRAADLLIVDADPLRDVGNVRRIHAVVARGRLLRRPDLDALLDRAAREARADRPLAPAQPPSATGRPSSSSRASAFAWVAGPGRAR